MALNEIDDVYGTQDQVEFARRMAESLLKGAGTGMPDASMAVLPGTWAYGAGNVLRALAGNQYRGIAGSQDKTLSDRMLDPNAPNTAKNLRNSQIRNQTRPTPPPRHDYSGGNPDATGAANANADVTPTSGSDFINKVRMIESGGRPDAVTGSYRGHFQFGKAEEKRYGIDDTNWKDPRVAEAAFKKHMAWLYPQLEKKLGRAPTPGELYLAHQQGVAGGPALLSNPDKPAWEAIRPYYNSDYMAKLAVSGNIPKSSPLKKIPVEQVMAGDFARQWTSRFDGAAPSGPKIAGQPELPGRMNLGGPKPEGEVQPTNQPLGDQLAQAPAFPSQPVPPQQAMPVPPAGPLETDAQLQARLRAAPAGQRQQIMEDYLKRAQGRDFETTTGKGVVTPGRNGEPPTVSHTPSKGFPIHTGKFSGTVLPNQQGGFELTIPGQPGKSFGSLNEIFQYMREQEAMDTASQKITEGQSNEITEAISQGNKAPQLIKSLNTLDTLSKSGDVPRGPLSKYSVAVRQVLDNLGLTKYIPDIASADLTKAETIQKINAELARQAVNSFTNRGTNFELETYIQNNPGILQSKQGMEMLIDIIRQEYKGIQEIGKIANSTKPGDIAEFQGKIAKYYEENPIIITGPIVDPKTKKVIDPNGKLTTRNIQNEEDISKVPSGQYFMLPSGRMGKKP